MDRRLALAIALLSVSFSAGAAPPASDRPGAPADGQPDMKAMMERNRRCIRALSAEAAKVTFSRKDLDAYLAEWRSFEELDLDDENDAVDCVDVSKAAADPRYVAWARERRLDPKPWMLKSMRITLTYTKRRAPQQVAEMKQQMEGQRRELEKQCKNMGPTACRDLQQAFASGDELVRESQAMWALFPEPTRAEAALLDEYDARLRQVIEEERRAGRGRHGDIPGEDDPGAEDAGNEDPAPKEEAP